MADAKRCDKCGKYYSIPISYPVVNLIDEDTMQIWDIGNNRRAVDLCPDCWKSFEKWWGNKKIVSKKTDNWTSPYPEGTH